MKTKPNALTVFLIVLLMILVMGVGALSALAARNTRELREALKIVDEKAADLGKKTSDLGEKTSELIGKIEKIENPEPEETKENDVCIAGNYYIRDTSAISDAYKSGDRSGLDDRQKETLKMASDVLDEIIEPDMTPFEKEQAVYVFLTTRLKQDEGSLTVIPNSGEDADNPYGVLKYHQAVCVGYATTFRLFMHMLDIDCMVVHDTSLNHSWDEVRLDGEWYHTDCFFDTSSSEPSFRHFNVSDNVLLQDHSWDRSFFPHANGFKFNYCVMNAGEVDDLMAIPAYVKEKLENGEASFSLRVKGGIAKDEEPVAAYLISTLSDAVNSFGRGYFQYYWSTDENEQYVLCMFYTSYNEDPAIQIPDDVAEKINGIVWDLFDGSWAF